MHGAEQVFHNIQEGIRKIPHWTTRKCDFSEGPTWLKCPHWPRGMVVLIKGVKHEKHELLLIETFD